MGKKNRVIYGSRADYMATCRAMFEITLSGCTQSSTWSGVLHGNALACLCSRENTLTCLCLREIEFTCLCSCENVFVTCHCSRGNVLYLPLFARKFLATCLCSRENVCHAPLVVFQFGLFLCWAWVCLSKKHVYGLWRNAQACVCETSVCDGTLACSQKFCVRGSNVLFVHVAYVCCICPCLLR